MIQTRKQLKHFFDVEFVNYFSSKRDYFKSALTKNERYMIWKFQKNLRKAEYYHNKGGFLSLLPYYVCIRKKNRLGVLLGIHMMINCIDEGLCIYHSGNIVVSGLSKIGKNLKLHGSNCIGNKGNDDKVPTIGDNCDFGFGAIAIGDIAIGNNCVIGSNCVVNKSFGNDSKIIGLPGRKYER